MLLLLLLQARKVSSIAIRCRSAWLATFVLGDFRVGGLGRKGVKTCGKRESHESYESGLVCV